MAGETDNQPEPPESERVLGSSYSEPDKAGPGMFGDGAARVGKGNMRLVRRAIGGRWNVPEEIKKLVVNQMAVVVGRSEKNEDKIGAARVLIAADLSDARREAADQRADFWQAEYYAPDPAPADPAPTGGVTINGNVNVINAGDGDRARLAALAERLGLGGVVAGPGPNGSAGHSGPNGSSEGGKNGRPVDDADDADDEAG